MDGLVLMLTGFVCFGAGLAFSDFCFTRIIREKANTGIRLERGGQLFVVKYAIDEVIERMDDEI